MSFLLTTNRKSPVCFQNMGSDLKFGAPSGEISMMSLPVIEKRPKSPKPLQIGVSFLLNTKSLVGFQNIPKKHLSFHIAIFHIDSISRDGPFASRLSKILEWTWSSWSRRLRPGCLRGTFARFHQTTNYTCKRGTQEKKTEFFDAGWHFLTCASGCVVESRICNREVAGSNLGRCYFAPRSSQLSIPPGSVNEYQL